MLVRRAWLWGRCQTRPALCQLSGLAAPASSTGDGVNARVPPARDEEDNKFLKAYQDSMAMSFNVAAASPDKPQSRTTPATEFQPPAKQPQINSMGESHGVGKRKDAVARVWIKPGRGLVTINRRPLPVYIKTIERRHDVLDPLILVDVLGRFDVDAIVRGGGTTGQAQALKLGIARALEKHTPEFRPLLRAAGMLTRDSRVVERKKPGQKKARKKFQWVKR